MEQLQEALQHEVADLPPSAAPLLVVQVDERGLRQGAHHHLYQHCVGGGGGGGNKREIIIGFLVRCILLDTDLARAEFSREN